MWWLPFTDSAYSHTDQVTGENIGSNATDYWTRVVQPCVDAGTNWVTIFGNHGEHFGSCMDFSLLSYTSIHSGIALPPGHSNVARDTDDNITLFIAHVHAQYTGY